MKEKKQKFALTIIGKPSTKKRPRIVPGVSKTGKLYTAKYTPDDWAEYMIREAFLEAFPYSEGYKPIGWSCCKPNEDPENYQWEKLDGIRDVDLPKVELDVIFYFKGGKIGDLDNYIKTVFDALNDYAYIDDRQIKHFKPYIVNLSEYDELMEEDETFFQEYATVERVDILVRHYNFLADRLFNAIRRYFKKKAKVVDLTDKYYKKKEINK